MLLSSSLKEVLLVVELEEVLLTLLVVWITGLRAGTVVAVLLLEEVLLLLARLSMGFLVDCEDPLVVVDVDDPTGFLAGAGLRLEWVLWGLAVVVRSGGVGRWVVTGTREGVVVGAGVVVVVVVEVLLVVVVVLLVVLLAAELLDVGLEIELETGKQIGF